MTTKDKIIRVIESLDDDASVDDVIDRLYLLRKFDSLMQLDNLADAGRTLYAWSTNGTAPGGNTRPMDSVLSIGAGNN
ncbi:MAG: hypothetical protein WD049_04360 [Candidatus Paceibacterota bacterium]